MVARAEGARDDRDGNPARDERPTDLLAGHGSPRPAAAPRWSRRLWVDGSFYFTSGAGTRKSRNLAANPKCVISVALNGIDLVVEGTARRVTDEPTLRRLAELYAAQGWPARVSDGAITAEYSAPSAGPAPWDLYVVTPSTAFGVATAEPYGATRWRFESSASPRPGTKRNP